MGRFAEIDALTKQFDGNPFPALCEHRYTNEHGACPGPNPKPLAIAITPELMEALRWARASARFGRAADRRHDKALSAALREAGDGG